MAHSLSETVDVVFFGTHEFAVEILSGLVQDPMIRVVEVITQPDRPVGRKQILQPPPVKVFAEKQHLRISQPPSLKTYTVDSGGYHLNIVAQYGKLVPAHIIQAPRHGTINVHTSLLPKYRGASPIQAALLHGESETGVTIMVMDEGLDTGPILTQEKITIGPDEIYDELEKKLAAVGRQLLLKTIPLYVSGQIRPVAQSNVGVTLCKQLTREEGRVDWKQTATEIYNQFRALSPWPGIWTTWNNQRVKLLRIAPATQHIDSGAVTVDGNRLFVGCGEQSIELHTLQLEGRNPTSAADFIKGHPGVSGTTFQ